MAELESRSTRRWRYRLEASWFREDELRAKVGRLEASREADALEAKALERDMGTLEEENQRLRNEIKGWAHGAAELRRQLAEAREMAARRYSPLVELVELAAQVDFGIPPPGWDRLVRHAHEASRG